MTKSLGGGKLGEVIACLCLQMLAFQEDILLKDLQGRNYQFLRLRGVVCHTTDNQTWLGVTNTMGTNAEP